MSNPAVIMLTDTPTKSGGRFKVEDNIGESIHIHYDNFRIDFTIKEFLVFSDLIEQCYKRFNNIENFQLNNFDPVFLHSISHMLVDLEDVVFDKVFLKELRISKKGLFGIPSWADLNHSKVFKAIHGDTKDNDNYVQENFVNQSNQERVLSIKSIVDQKGYPFNNEYIVLFNNQNFIRDGQHRASSLLKKHGNIEIKVIRLKFKDSKHNLKQNLWLNSIVPTLKKTTKKVLKKILKRSKVLRQIKGKITK